MFYVGLFKIPDDIPEVYAQLLEMQPMSYWDLDDPRPLKRISEEIYESLTPRIQIPSHHFDAGAPITNVNNKVNIGNIPGKVLKDMAECVRFRNPGKSASRFTWTKITDTKADPRKRGGVGTSHDTHVEVCKAIWALYDKDWRSWVMVNS